MKHKTEEIVKHKTKEIVKHKSKDKKWHQERLDLGNYHAGLFVKPPQIG